MGWIEIPLGLLIVATETGPLIEDADPFPKIVVTLLTLFNQYLLNLNFNEEMKEKERKRNLTIKIQNFESVIEKIGY